MSLVFRSFALIRGAVSRVVSYFERRNPEALLENERENLRRLIGQFNEGLVSHAAVWERLITQVSRAEKQATELTTLINGYLKMGDRASAAQHALDLKEVNAQIDTDRAQITASEQTYNQLIRRRNDAVAETRKRIEQVRRQIGDLKIKRAIADLEGMAQAMIGKLDGSGDSLARLQDLVADERDAAAAHARVAQGQFEPDIDRARETLRGALADEALADFLAGQGKAALPKAIPDLSAVLDPLAQPLGRKGKTQ